MVVAAFVAPYLLEATARFVAAAAELPDVRLGLVTSEPAERLPPELREHLAGHWRVDDALDPRQLAEAVRGLGRQLGRVERLVGALEQLQVPLAQVREALGIPGMDVRTALNVRDKSQMKRCCAAAGMPCARHRSSPRRRGDWRSPTRSASRWSPSRRPAPGAQSTFRLDDGDMLRGWLAAVPPGGDAPALLEEFLTGEEHTFDSVTVGGTTVWSSIADYRPPPLEVLRNPWIQWTVVVPRDIDRPALRGHPGGRGRLRCGRSAYRRAHPHGVVRPARRLGRRLGGGGAAAGRPDHLDARLRARLRPVPRVGASWSSTAGSTRPSAGSRPGRPTCAARGAAGCARCTASTAVQRRSATWSSRRGCRSRASRPPRLLGEGYVDGAAIPTPPWSEDAMHRIVSRVRVELAEA